MRAGDRIVAVWGRLTKYAPLEDLIEQLAEGPDHSEVQVTLERDVEIGRRLAGLTLALGEAGLVVETLEAGGSAAEAGVKVGDRVVSLGGQSTRYLPLEEARRLLERGEGATVMLTIRRDVAMWRRPLARKGF